jgi:ribosome-associated protein
MNITEDVMKRGNSMSEMANTKERSGEFARIAIAALEEKKATEIRVIDISEVSVLADYFIIANGSNRPQMQAMSDEVSEKMEKAGAVLKQVEGYDNASWILMDFGDVIVHIFGEQDRLLYDLERIWRDGKQMDPDQL